MKRMNDFDDDIAGGMKFLKAHFSELERPDRSALYEILCEREGEMPEEARRDLSSLAFRCDPGRKQLLDGLERTRDKCPPELRRSMFGD